MEAIRSEPTNESLYALNARAPRVDSAGGGRENPDTVLTASIETIDNDRARLMSGVGVVR